MLLSPFVLKEKVGKESIAALFLAITGVYLVIRPESGFGTLEFSGSRLIRIVSGLFAGMLLAVIIMNVRVLKRDHSEFANLQSQTGSLLALIEPVAGYFFLPEWRTPAEGGGEKKLTILSLAGIRQ